MRLNSIKLSGFKSFAEPTHLQLPGSLVGVVGPNGCGKSNIMDAVRWVLGESKASELRGESMQDVIFNGSGQRKPAGRASVELVFGNEDGRAGGAWSRYAEIAVKRVLTRDGTSSYYINGQPVRRRDVQDVFLGTGLGPRAYAIIGQGTISRIIESRPEELRLFLEEAAGVSKYKERRRETEQRLGDTRENLSRVEDIVRELEAGLARLERQAEVAGRFRALREEGTLRLHQLWFLRRRDAAAEEARVRREADVATTALEARLADLRRVEAELEAVRQAHYAAGDALHAAQAALAEATVEVSRLEERIRHVAENRRRIERRLAELEAEAAQWQGRRTQAETEAARLAGAIDDAERRGRALADEVRRAADRVPALEDALRAAQTAAATQRAAVAAVQRQIEVLAAESRAVGEQARQLGARRERLNAEARGLATPDPGRLAALGLEQAAAAAADAELHARLDELAAESLRLDAERRALQTGQAAEGARQAGLAARLAALRALQEKVQTHGKLPPWLARHGLDGLPGLWKRLHVEPGWEPALEAALRERLGAIAVGRIETVRAFEADAPPARLAFYTLADAAPVHGAATVAGGDAALGGAPAATEAALPRLADRLRIEDAALAALVGDWLHGVFTAPSLEAALGARGRLAAGEMVITPAGHAVSARAVSFHAPDSEQAGLLQRAQEIEQLEADLAAQTVRADAARAALARADAACGDVAQRLATGRRQAGETRALAHRLHVELTRVGQQAEAAEARRGRLVDELAETDAALGELAARQALAEARFEALDGELAETQQEQVGLDDGVRRAERALAEAREAWRTLERQAQEAHFAARSLAARRDELLRAAEAAVQQRAAAEAAAAPLVEELGRLDDAAARAGLDEALAVRLERERALGARRSDFDGLAAAMRRLDEERQRVEHGLAPLRERITRLQLEAQAAQLGGAQYAGQLEQAQADLDALAAGIARDGVRLDGLQAEIDRIEREAAALGAVNLAALEELGEARERKAFLDAQMADLLEAVGTLEGAIRKIDLETRELLGSTFETVDGHFGRLFPQLFGGGMARLVMTGDEILDAGVQVLAQPPGKKNSTIHLLSGGEKALTAIALVFAIFQLNPAPFCLLDEVDAPLDDANTERYAKLVREMAADTQFLFVSHNKIAMEMAGQLIGVTMQEQGVSRIVAVDMAEAVGLAEAA